MGQGVSFEEKLKENTANIAKKHGDIDALVDEINEEGNRLIALINQRKYTDREGICNHLAYQYVDTLSDFFPVQTLSDVRYRLGIVPENTPELETSKKQVCVDIVNFYVRKINLITSIQAELPNCKNMEREIYDELNQKLKEDNLSDEEWLEVYEQMKDFNRDIRSRYELFQEQIEEIRQAKTSVELDRVAKKTHNILAKTGAMCKNYRHSLLPYASKRTSPHKQGRDWDQGRGIIRDEVRVMTPTEVRRKREEVKNTIAKEERKERNELDQRIEERKISRQKQEIPAYSPIIYRRASVREVNRELIPIESPFGSPTSPRNDRIVTQNSTSKPLYAKRMVAPTPYRASVKPVRQVATRSAPETVQPIVRQSLRKVPAPVQTGAPTPLYAKEVSAPQVRRVPSVISTPTPLYAETVSAPQVRRVPSVVTAPTPQVRRVSVAPTPQVRRVPSVISTPTPLYVQEISAPQVLRVPSVVSVPQVIRPTERLVRSEPVMMTPVLPVQDVPMKQKTPVVFEGDTSAPSWQPAEIAVVSQIEQFHELPRLKNGKKPTKNVEAYDVNVFNSYTAKGGGEISVNRGDTVTYFGSSSNGWARIRKNNGNFGYVPVNILSM